MRFADAALPTSGACGCPLVRATIITKAVKFARKISVKVLRYAEKKTSVLGLGRLRLIRGVT